LIAAPLIVDDEVLGSLCINRMAANFTEEDLALTETFAAYASTALRNAQSHFNLQREVEERRNAEEALRISEERYMLASLGASDGLWDWDLRANQIYLSPRWKSMLGYSDSEITSNPEDWFSRIHPEDLELVRFNLSKHLQGLTPHFECEYRMRHKDDTYRWILSRGLAVRAPDKSSDTAGLTPYRMAGSQTDITARKKTEEQLIHDALHDALTRLPNRSLFLDRLGRAIERTNRRPENPFAVLFLDLDRFKVINDSLGHTAGDQLLIAIAKRLSLCLRSSDTAARLGGDEFVVLLEDIQGVHDAIAVTDRINKSLKAPFDLDGHEVVVTASIGIVLGANVLSSTSYEQAEDVLRDADIAMYRAKALGKNRFVVFDPSLRTHAIARLECEYELRMALERGEFKLHYQPICSLSNDQITGFEALLRWYSPTRGIVLPGEFIPVAEETGLIIPIGEWVLREACHQIIAWQQEYPSDPPLSINVNISGVQFANHALLDQVMGVLNETGLSPGRLRLEITESVFMENAENAAVVLQTLRQMGVHLQIDDFGTGYSSLSYLQNFPINAIKIDRSFISRMDPNNPDASSGSEIVKTIVALAHDLGVEAVAEGVETLDQLEQLKALECQYGQGFYLGLPMEASAAEAKLIVRDVNAALQPLGRDRS
ncbi:MAG TPA: EAL domain-containing protein, partial [Anaerolineales bacterium]